MSTLQKEIQDYIKVLPDSALIALRPIITLLIAEEPIIETDLTEEEKEIIKKGRKEYLLNPGCFKSLDNISM